MKTNRRQRPRRPTAAEIERDANTSDEEFRAAIMSAVYRGDVKRRRAASERRQHRVNKRWKKFAAKRLKEMDKKVKYSHEYSEQKSHPLTAADKKVIRYLLARHFQQKRIAALFDVNQGRVAEVHKAMERGDYS